MNDTATTIETLVEKAGDYTKTKIELFKLSAVDKSADVVAGLATKLAVAIVVAVFVFSLNIGIALWIGEMLGRACYGFFIIAGCYGLVALLLYIFRHQCIKTPVSNAIITQMLPKKSV